MYTSAVMLLPCAAIYPYMACKEHITIAKQWLIFTSNTLFLISHRQLTNNPRRQGRDPITPSAAVSIVDATQL